MSFAIFLNFLLYDELFRAAEYKSSLCVGLGRLVMPFVGHIKYTTK